MNQYMPLPIEYTKADRAMLEWLAFCRRPATICERIRAIPAPSPTDSGMLRMRLNELCHLPAHAYPGEAEAIRATLRARGEGRGES